MVVLLQTEEFRTLPTRSVWLLVGLKLPSGTTGSRGHVVLGRCECLSAAEEIPALFSHGLATPMWAESWRRVKGCFPGGCDMCGACVAVEGRGCGKEIARELFRSTDLLEVMGERGLIVVKSEEIVAYEASDLGSLDEVGVASVDDYISSNTCLLRVCSSLPAVVDPRQANKENLLAQLPSSRPVFLLSSLSLLLPHPSHSVHTSHQTLRELLQTSDRQEPFLPVELLEVPEGISKPISLSFSSPLPSSWTKLALPIDAIALLHLDLSLEEVGQVLWEAVQRQLSAVASAMLWKPNSLYNVAIHHFPPSSFHLCPLSIPYPHTEAANPDSPVDDLALTSLRRAWHIALALPFDLPRLRITNTHLFSPHRHGPHLLSPHTSLPHSPNGTVAMVTGGYTYHHYQQDNFNDTGWGCAYRSLQTLWSWFHLQGFTAEAPPTHLQIQEALVATGDKQGRFVGSREWIGSFEVSTVLNHLLGLECRIHHVSNGSEMSGVGRVLLHHFTNEGTPVMIGGGVLAHTILGVDYNTSSGAIKFLVLDPHYTGQDDITLILKKGWCGWKPVAFWDKKAHYNMCLPLRPRQV